MRVVSKKLIDASVIWLAARKYRTKYRNFLQESIIIEGHWSIIYSLPAINIRKIELAIEKVMTF